MALPYVRGVLRAQRQRWWSAAALKQGLSEQPFDGHFFQGLVMAGEASSCSAPEGSQSRAIQTSAVLEARFRAARKEFWNPLLASEGQERLEEELSKLRSFWQKSAEGNAASSQQESESKGGGTDKSSKGRSVADKETPPGHTHGSKVHLNRPEGGSRSAGSAAQNVSRHSKRKGERYQSGGVSDLDSGTPLQKTRVFGVHPLSSSPGIESEGAALPKVNKSLPIDSQHGADAQRGQLKSQASTATLRASSRKQAIGQKERGNGWGVNSGRPRVGQLEAGEKKFDGHFAVRQGTAVTASQWLEVEPDTESDWESAERRHEFVEGSVGSDVVRNKAAEAESKEMGLKAFGSAKTDQQGGVQRNKLEQNAGSADGLKEAAGAVSVSAPERSEHVSESRGIISNLADGAEDVSSLTSVHQESQQELLDEEANSRLGSNSQQPSLGQHKEKSLPVSSSQQASRSSEGNAESLEQRDRQPESLSNLSEESTASSQSPLGGGLPEARSQYGNEPSELLGVADGEKEAESVPDLEELRTWLTQLDRREEEEEEDVATIASVPVGQQKALRLAIMGPPNAGKSVLTNALVGSKVSAVSAKTNTTRAAILGVSTHRSTQLVICDTPGLAGLAPGKALRSTNKQLVNRAQRAGVDCDAVIVVIDAAREIERPDPRIPRMISSLSEQLPEGQRHVLVLNKADAIHRQDRPKLEALRERFQELHAFDRCFVTSGKKELGLKQLQRYLRQNAVLRPWELPEDRPTDLTDEQRAMDIVRQHLLDRLHKEVPYKIVVKPVSWEETESGLLEIRQDLVVDRKKLKAMVVGKGGATIKQITLGAREELGMILDRRIELFLNVRVEGT